MINALYNISMTVCVFAMAKDSNKITSPQFVALIFLFPLTRHLSSWANRSVFRFWHMWVGCIHSRPALAPASTCSSCLWITTCAEASYRRSTEVSCRLPTRSAGAESTFQTSSDDVLCSKVKRWASCLGNGEFIISSGWQAYLPKNNLFFWINTYYYAIET